MQLTGIHHVTCVTADAKTNLAFYTDVLGMRLVKCTVNQDDVRAYHLFYADGEASPGTDLTFFDWPMRRERRGVNSVTATGLRVGSTAALAYWKDRLSRESYTSSQLEEIGGEQRLTFEDPEGQRLFFIVDEGAKGKPWDRSNVEPQFQIIGLGPLEFTVRSAASTKSTLKDVLGFSTTAEYIHNGKSVSVFELPTTGKSGQIRLIEDPEGEPARIGAGAVHHIALRTPTTEEYHQWSARLSAAGFQHSGPVDRFYFRSLYFREPNGILIEIATDEPGFTVDEPLASLGEHLSLPPFLESRREEIEKGLKPIR